MCYVLYLMSQKKQLHPYSYPISPASLPNWKRLLLHWSKQFPQALFLDSNQYQQDQFARYEVLLGVSSNTESTLHHKYNCNKDLFKALNKLHDSNWLFGHLTYELKDLIEPQLSSHLADALNFPMAHFFEAEIVVQIPKSANELLILATDDETAGRVFQAIALTYMDLAEPIPQQVPIALKARTTKAAYLEKLHALKAHIQRGDIYEVNLCQEFYAEDVSLDPVYTFEELNNIGKAPFSAFYKLQSHYLLCASPERYLQKENSTLRSQPIKGTIKRGKNKQEDNTLQNKLLASKKDKSENVMIVDLVRNDLTRCAKLGSIKVAELFGLYSFNTVHHLISTIVCEMEEGLPFTEAFQASFPMGSMTGAPKVSAMQLIEKHEDRRRGLYSGSVGYIDPNGDFDFNVVIRSLLYNAENQYLSCQVGGAITHYSDPESEYEECLLKAEGVMRALGAI